ncbi:hypothetical protein CKAN_00836300 [Cinnamomum micranthum f. kanehirae]|uniref:Uncharacterized protein n=1 Tax=Cinnamomum micranthum f. kanehirae TaxID=337451 RepID=A0A443NMQ6_9MAGN|nr:hypothetical protein CKAN_00836300 [Cinnamomum micranthum f. kanehirae]
MKLPSNCTVATFQVPTHFHGTWLLHLMNRSLSFLSCLCCGICQTKNFAASFIAAQVKPFYFQAIAPLLPSSFQPIAQHLLKERDFPRNFSVASISRIKISLFFHLNLLCVICQTKLLAIGYCYWNNGSCNIDGGRGSFKCHFSAFAGYIRPSFPRKSRPSFRCGKGGKKAQINPLEN